LSQVGTKPEGGRPEGGVRAAARELGIQKSEAHRAVKIASMAPEAKKAAKEAGLDNNQSALERIARKPKEEQVAEVGRIKEEKSAPKTLDTDDAESAQWTEEDERTYGDLLDAWADATGPDTGRSQPQAQ
jgi:hypothetical protein